MSRGPCQLTGPDDPSSDTSLVLALVTLSPILLMVRAQPYTAASRALIRPQQPAYAVLAVYTRELTIINMWAGQLLSEGLNLVLKHTFKQERPVGMYSFPKLFPHEAVSQSKMVLEIFLIR